MSQGRHRRQGPREVPDQRAGRGQAQVADRRVPRVLRGRGRAAHRRRHARHRRHRRRDAPPRRRVPHDPATPTTRRSPSACPRSTSSWPTCSEQGILVDRDDEGYLLQIFTQADRRPPDACSSRSSSATARAASATATSRRCSRPSSASRRSAGTCRPCATLSLGDVPAKRHAQTRRDGKLLVEEVLGYEGFSGNESILYHLHSPVPARRRRRVHADRARGVGARHPRAPARRRQPDRPRAATRSPAAGC